MRETVWCHQPREQGKTEEKRKGTTKGGWEGGRKARPITAEENGTMETRSFPRSERKHLTGKKSFYRDESYDRGLYKAEKKRQSSVQRGPGLYRTKKGGLVKLRWHLDTKAGN